MRITITQLNSAGCSILELQYTLDLENTLEHNAVRSALGDFLRQTYLNVGDTLEIRGEL